MEKVGKIINIRGKNGAEKVNATCNTKSWISFLSKDIANKICRINRFGKNKITVFYDGITKTEVIGISAFTTKIKDLEINSLAYVLDTNEGFQLYIGQDVQKKYKNYSQC